MAWLLSTAPSRFDLLLGVMGLALAVGLGLALFSTVSVRVAGVGAAALAGVAMLDGLVWHPPGG